MSDERRRARERATRADIGDEAARRAVAADVARTGTVDPDALIVRGIAGAFDALSLHEILAGRPRTDFA